MGEPVAEEFAQLAIELHGQRTLRETVEQVVQSAITAVGCDYANVVVAYGTNNVEIKATTDPVGEKIAQLLARYGEGPALDLPAEPGSRIVVHDASSETRWPRWCRELADLGVHSALCTRLATSVSTIGALNLYSKEPLGFDADDVDVAHILARHASVALAASREQAALAHHIDARKRIGQAQGILMERFQLNPDQADEVLRRYSQQHNLKLNEVAERLITTRRLPGDS